jgi:cytochrome c biogenesis protein CcdA
VTELASAWYGVLSRASGEMSLSMRDVVIAGGIPPIAIVLVLGVIGAISPCQLTTGLSAIALIGRRPHARQLLAGLAYVAGKATTYGALGLLFVAFGGIVTASAIPVVGVVRRILGPLMIVVGLALIGVLRSRVRLGTFDRLAFAASDRFDATRPSGAYALGVAFGLVFCPTLFLLFFGMVIPLTVTSAGGVLFPSVFALGTGLPLLIILLLMWLGFGGQPSPALQRWLTRAAGVVAVLAGLNDTIIYWSA